MKASLRALLEQIIDYAGMFPPAQLPPPAAVGNYVRYRESPEGWMLGRFLCPAGKLPELLPLCQEWFTPAQPLRLSILATNAQNAMELKNTLSQDFSVMRSFLSKCGKQAVMEGLEIRVPPISSQQPGVEVKEIVLTTAKKIEELGCPITPWYETTPGPGLARNAEHLILCLGASNKVSREMPWVCAQPAGWKLRCGGPDPAAIPSSSQIADLLSSCHSAQVGFKATAGLHHPFRNFDPGLQTYLHGFINLFLAAVLSYSQVEKRKIISLLDDTEPAHFHFEDAGVRWKEHFVTTAHISHLRTKMATSFGSCSFEEPVADLKALGRLA